eukprot:scaffold50602_cov14-Tisochrysis_lutea.AAC.1
MLEAVRVKKRKTRESSEFTAVLTFYTNTTSIPQQLTNRPQSSHSTDRQTQKCAKWSQIRHSHDETPALEALLDLGSAGMHKKDQGTHNKFGGCERPSSQQVLNRLAKQDLKLGS